MLSRSQSAMKNIKHIERLTARASVLVAVRQELARLSRVHFRAYPARIDVGALLRYVGDGLRAV